MSLKKKKKQSSYWTQNASLHYGQKDTYLVMVLQILKFIRKRKLQKLSNVLYPKKYCEPLPHLPPFHYSELERKAPINYMRQVIWTSQRCSEILLFTYRAHSIFFISFPCGTTSLLRMNKFFWNEIICMRAYQRGGKVTAYSLTFFLPRRRLRNLESSLVLILGGRKQSQAFYQMLGQIPL